LSNILEKHKNIFGYKSLNSFTKKENKVSIVENTLDKKEYNNMIYYPSSTKE
jgi:hypothetical protein